MTTNQQIQNILDKQWTAGRLAHAYLFVGPKGAGKTALAQEFAEKVLFGLSQPQLNNNLSVPSGHLPSLGERLHRHPDYLEFDCLVEPEEQAKNVREFITRIALKPFVAKKKFAVIFNAEQLNLHGANALLKTLEEPPANTVIILLANTRKLLPTIISRCQVFNFNHRLERRFETTQINADIKDKENSFNQSIDNYVGKSLGERLIAVQKFAELEDVELSQKIEEFVYYSAEQISTQPEKHTHLSAGLKTFADLNTNKNKKFVMQGLMMKI